MFVVAIICSCYDGDVGRDESYTLDRLYETTEGAKAEIARIIYEEKKKVWLREKEQQFYNKYEKDFEEANPEPPNPRDHEGKPVYQAGLGKDYQRTHEARVHEWHDEVQQPRRARWQSWVDCKRNYINENVEPIMADIHRFIDIEKISIDAVVLKNYSEVEYSTKVLEVFK